jgi:hypothetical protein
VIGAGINPSTRAHAIDALTPASTADTLSVSSFTSPPPGGS